MADIGRSTGFEVMRKPDGTILQSGAYSKPRTALRDVSNVGGWITRAVVLQVYYPEEDDRLGLNQKAITCDVRTYGRYSRMLMKVPLLQATHGLYDGDIYVPRAATVALSGGAVIKEPDANNQPTPAEDVDGDHVLIGFLDNDPSQPVVLPFQLAHPETRYLPAKSDGRVRRISHNGSVMSWDSAGNWSIDATGASEAGLGTKGVEVSSSGVGGRISLSTTDGTNETSIQLNNQAQILLGGSPSGTIDEPMVMGNLWIDFMDRMITAVLAIQVGTAVGPSSTVIGQALIDLTALKVELATKAQVSDFIFGKKAL